MIQHQRYVFDVLPVFSPLAISSTERSRVLFKRLAFRLRDSVGQNKTISLFFLNTFRVFDSSNILYGTMTP